MVAFKIKPLLDAPQQELLELPWSTPLEHWPDDRFVRFPRGLARHVVRFLDYRGSYYALKELPDALAEREYRMLDHLRDQGLPVVTLTGIATHRRTAEREPLDGVLITRHLGYSLPYRSLFKGPSHPGQRHQLVDALAVLLARLHLVGFFWGDCSLNNALFRRDAGLLRAYLVDTETGELHQTLSDGQREYELDIAATNIAGGLLDLQASGRLAEDIDPAEVADELVDRYRSLWAELTATEVIPSGELWRMQERMRRLNDLGFDAEEFELVALQDRAAVRFRPSVVEEGHHKRALQQLTGIVAHENQARRLLGAIRSYGAWLTEQSGQEVPEAILAYRFLTERYQPTLDAIPPGLRGRLEDAEIFHQILEHTWYLSEDAGHDVGLEAATASYVDEVLSKLPDESHILTLETAELAVGDPNQTLDI